MSNFVPFSNWATSFSVSVLLASAIARASIFSAMYSIHAWFSGTLPCFLMNAATNALERGFASVWYHTVGHVPLRLPSPAAHASAVFRLNPTVGKGRPYSAYCFTKFVTWLPARFRHTTSGAD